MFCHFEGLNTHAFWCFFGLSMMNLIQPSTVGKRTKENLGIFTCKNRHPRWFSLVLPWGGDHRFPDIYEPSTAGMVGRIKDMLSSIRWTRLLFYFSNPSLLLDPHFVGHHVCLFIVHHFAWWSFLFCWLRAPFLLVTVNRSLFVRLLDPISPAEEVFLLMNPLFVQVFMNFQRTASAQAHCFYLRPLEQPTVPEVNKMSTRPACVGIPWKPSDGDTS